MKMLILFVLLIAGCEVPPESVQELKALKDHCAEYKLELEKVGPLKKTPSNVEHQKKRCEEYGFWGGNN